VQFPGSNGVVIINDLHPGKGAIHTQAYYLSQNQTAARTRMDAGDSPQEIIDWLVANDFQSNPAVRQYGIVYFDASGSPRAAGHTGVNTDDYKNHIIGPNYAIQGNILLGPEILDSMEARFLNTGGSLANRLMAALQGGNVPGADTRCLNEGVSSLSSFIRVAQPNDLPGSYYLDIVVPSTPFGMEPIDSLQVLFDEWQATTGINPPNNKGVSVTFSPNPLGETAIFEIINANPNLQYELLIFDSVGKFVKQLDYHHNPAVLERNDLKTGVLFYQVLESGRVIKKGKVVVPN
jgi:uncharacterized Ntn-hydrolase superfamily protein